MAQAGPAIFNQKATERLNSPDDLDKYLRVVNPSVWVLLAACVRVMLGIVAWGFFGTASASVAKRGAVIDGKIVTFITTAEKDEIRPGNEVLLGNRILKVESVDTLPLSKGEARQLLGSDYLTWYLVQDEWVYRATISGGNSLAEGTPVTLTITTERVAPVKLLG